MSLRTFKADDMAYEKFKSICARERTGVGEKLNEFIEKYNKEHGDGNPNYSLDAFDHEEMKAVPAVFRDRDSWQSYIENLGEKDLQELQWQIQTINSLTNNKINHGTTNVRVF